MRMKRRNVVEEKGEIFRKSVCCVPCSDSEGDEVATDAESNNCKTAKQGKIEENTVIESTERKKNESRKKQMTSAHHEKRSTTKASRNSSNQKHCRSKQEHCEREEHSTRKQHQNDSRMAIISKNRITRSVGIYNKAKRSDTILRENLKQKLCKKKFEDIKTKTARDMARVLDCSSFKIQLSSCNAGLPDGQDSPIYHTSGGMDYLSQSPVSSSKTRSSCSSTEKYSNPDKNRVTPLQRITPQRITPKNDAALAFKTPLQEISETLTGALKPSETFHGRDFFAEVQGQLRKMYKQSSVNFHVQRMGNSTGVASEVQKRCLKRKSVEENGSAMNYIGNESTAQTVEHCPTNSMVESERQSTSNIPTLQIESRENIKQQNRLPQIVSARESKTIRETSQTSTHFEFQDKYLSGENNRERRLGDEKEHDFSHGRDVQRCLFGQKDASFSCKDGKALTSAHNSSSFDILDFLDGVDRGSNVEEIQAHMDYMTPDPRLVSPPKKPTLDSPTPEKRFYPHKLY